MSPGGDLESSGSKPVDQQQSYPGGGAGAASVASALPDKSSYFCRGCGSRLPEGFRGHFHKECLQADKRRRVQARRAQERERFTKWMQRTVCPHCGLGYGDRRSSPPARCPGEASQGTQGGPNTSGWP
jgi:hypothetical protein